MADRLCEAQDTWPMDHLSICETNIAALLCHVIRWKERNPDTCVLSAYVTQESDDENIWCKLTFITPGEQG